MFKSDSEMHKYIFLLINDCLLCFTTLRSVCFRRLVLSPIVMLQGTRIQIQFSAWLEQRNITRFKDWKLKLEYIQAKNTEQNVRCVSPQPKLKYARCYPLSFEVFQSRLGIFYKRYVFLQSSGRKRQKNIWERTQVTFLKPQKWPSWTQALL